MVAPISGSSTRHTRLDPSRGQRVKVERNGTRQVGQRSRAPGSRLLPGCDPWAVRLEREGEEREERGGADAGEGPGILRIRVKERSDMVYAARLCEPRANGVIRGAARPWRRSVPRAARSPAKGSGAGRGEMPLRASPPHEPHSMESNTVAMPSCSEHFSMSGISLLLAASVLGPYFSASHCSLASS